MTNSVGIIGCGWLGHPLAKKLVELGHHVAVTTTSNDKKIEFEDEGIHHEAANFPFSDSSESSESLAVFQQSQLVIAIPPQLKRGMTNYPDKIENIVKLAQQGNVEDIILISSSSIYNGLTGEVNETSTLDYSQEKVSVLHAAEQALLHFSGRTKIIRFSGLIGGNRHPGRFFGSGRTVENPTHPVNLIHLDDAIGIVLSVLEKPSYTGVINGVSPMHFDKKTFYSHAAISIGNKVPNFSAENLQPIGRTVISQQIKNLNYSFIYPNLLAWLEKSDNNH